MESLFLGPEYSGPDDELPYIHYFIIGFLCRVLNIHGGVTEGLWSCYGVIMESASFIIISIVNAIQMVTIDIMYQVL